METKKRIIISVTNYQDEAVISSRRWRYLAEYLKIKGYEITVVSHDAKETDRRLIINGIEVYALRNTGNYIKESTGRQGKATTIKNTLTPIVFFYYLIGDIWEQYRCNRVVRESFNRGILSELAGREYDLLISSVYNMDAFYIGVAMRSILKIGRHMCDVRDPIVNPFFGSKPQHFIGKRRLEHINSKIDCFTAVYECIINEIQLNLKQKAKPAFLLPHSFKEYLHNTYNSRDMMVFSLVGTYFPTNHDITPLVRTFHEMYNNKLISEMNCKVFVAGRNSDLVKNSFEMEGIGGLVKDLGFLCHDDAVELQQKSDVLIYLAAIDEVSKFSGVTGKFPEYLALDKELIMIFRIRNKAVEQLEYFDELSVGIALDSRDSEAEKKIKEWINIKMDEKRRGRVIHSPNMELLMEFYIGNVADKLEKIFATI